MIIPIKKKNPVVLGSKGQILRSQWLYEYIGYVFGVLGKPQESLVEKGDIFSLPLHQSGVGVEFPGVGRKLYAWQVRPAEW